MMMRDWEATIQTMVEESNRESKESGKHRVLTQWRAKLAQEPYLLPLYQIDEIVRKYRQRLTCTPLQMSSGSQDHLAQSTQLPTCT